MLLAVADANRDLIDLQIKSQERSQQNREVKKVTSLHPCDDCPMLCDAASENFLRDVTSHPQPTDKYSNRPLDGCPIWEFVFCADARQMKLVIGDTEWLTAAAAA